MDNSRIDLLSKSGILLVDKQQEWTSHDTVAKLRNILDTRKVGHAGTLDPLATGLLVVGVNKATRMLNYLVGADKTYEAVMRIGQTTITDDAAGEIRKTFSTEAITREKILDLVPKFLGPISQIPSNVSAIKISGKRAYTRVREGEDFVLPARNIVINSFLITDISFGNFVDISFTINCSSGTYIRSIARDFGAALNSGGHLLSLHRSTVGKYTVTAAKTLAQLIDMNSPYSALISLENVASQLFDSRVLDDSECNNIRYGRRIYLETKEIQNNINVFEETNEIQNHINAPSGMKNNNIIRDSETVYAGFSYDGNLVALLQDTDSYTKSVLVF